MQYDYILESKAGFSVSSKEVMNKQLDSISHLNAPN